MTLTNGDLAMLTLLIFSTIFGVYALWCFGGLRNVYNKMKKSKNVFKYTIEELDLLDIKMIMLIVFIVGLLMGFFIGVNT